MASSETEGDWGEMITDEQKDAFLDHDVRCNCAACGLVIEEMSRSEGGLKTLSLIESKGCVELSRIRSIRSRAK